MPHSRTECAGYFLLTLALLLCGCAARDIDATYGRRRGLSGAASVNGTAVLAELFQKAGHRVASRSYLSPVVHDFQVIVWAPDDFGVPPADAQEFLDDWLARGGERTLIYIGRDYDAAADYWERVQPTAPPGQAVEVQRRLAKARARHDSDRVRMPADEEDVWFRVRRDAPRRQFGKREPQPTPLQGAWCRSAAIDPAQVDVTLEGRLEALDEYPAGIFGGATETEVLLAAGEDALAWRLTNPDWQGGQIVVVANGSFLLNLPLVEKEHRKLAAQLIGQCPSGGRVLFLESGAGGPVVREHEPGAGGARGFEAFTVWPLGAILLHFVALGIVYLATRLKVFGRPHELPPESLSDFGRHITALGELLARTQDQQYARARLAFYQENVRRESGVSHRER